MDFYQYVHAIFHRGPFDLHHRTIIECGDYDQDRISAECARFGHLPGIDHEILAQDGQFAGRSRFDQIIFVTLKIRGVGENRKARSAPCSIGAGMGSGMEIFPDQALRR